MPAFLAPLAVSLGTSLLGKMLNRGGSRAADPYSRQLDADAARAAEMERQYMSMLRDFDPTAGIGEATDAELDMQEENFARGYANQLGSMVGRGRLPTRSGYGLRDAQDTIRQGQREREQIRRAGADRANAARATHLDRIGSATMAMGNRAYQARAGRINTMEAQQLQDRASRRGLFGQVLGGVIGAIPEAVRLYQGR